MSEIRISPYCRKLRTKKVFFLPHPPRNEEELLEASGHCWCAETGYAVGEDGDLTGPEECTRGRSCFTPYGAPRA